MRGCAASRLFGDLPVSVSVLVSLQVLFCFQKMETIAKKTSLDWFASLESKSSLNNTS